MQQVPLLVPVVLVAWPHVHLATRTITLRRIQTISRAQLNLLFADTSARPCTPAAAVVVAPAAVVVAPAAVVVAPAAVVDSPAPADDMFVRLPPLFLHLLRNKLSGRLFRFHHLAATLFHHLFRLDIRL